MSWTRFLRRARWDDERARELESYLDIETDANIARGMTPADARAAAHRKLGNVTLVREEIYRMNSARLRRDPVAGPALRRPAAAPQPRLRLRRASLARARHRREHRHLPGGGRRAAAHAPGEGPGRPRGGSASAWPRAAAPATSSMTIRGSPTRSGRRSAPHQQAFASLFAWGTTRFNLAEGGESRFARGLWVSGDFFSTLGVQPVAGRLLTPADDDRRACDSPAVVLSYPFWQAEFGGDHIGGRPRAAARRAPRGHRGRGATRLLRPRRRAQLRRGRAPVRAGGHPAGAARARPALHVVAGGVRAVEAGLDDRSRVGAPHRPVAGHLRGDAPGPIHAGGREELSRVPAPGIPGGHRRIRSARTGTARRSGCSCRSRASCSSSRARTSRISCWRARARAGARSPSASPSVRPGRASSGS